MGAGCGQHTSGAPSSEESSGHFRDLSLQGQEQLHHAAACVALQLEELAGRFGAGNPAHEEGMMGLP